MSASGHKPVCCYTNPLEVGVNPSSFWAWYQIRKKMTWRSPYFKIFWDISPHMTDTLDTYIFTTAVVCFQVCLTHRFPFLWDDFNHIFVIFFFQFVTLADTIMLHKGRFTENLLLQLIFFIQCIRWIQSSKGIKTDRYSDT